MLTALIIILLFYVLTSSSHTKSKNKAFRCLGRSRHSQCALLPSTRPGTRFTDGWAGGIVLKVFPPVLGFDPMSSGL